MQNQYCISGIPICDIIRKQLPPDPKGENIYVNNIYIITEFDPNNAFFVFSGRKHTLVDGIITSSHSWNTIKYQGIDRTVSKVQCTALKCLNNTLCTSQDIDVDLQQCAQYTSQ